MCRTIVYISLFIYSGEKDGNRMSEAVNVHIRKKNLSFLVLTMAISHCLRFLAWLSFIFLYNKERGNKPIGLCFLFSKKNPRDIDYKESLHYFRFYEMMYVEKAVRHF